MDNLLQKTLAQIVTDNYKAAEVLEKYDLDFCCKGKISLEKACTDRSLDMTKILAELANLYETNTDILSRFTNWDADFLTNYIENNHHSYVKTASERLLFYTDKIARVHGERHPELLKIAAHFNNVALEMKHHMEKEEIILFPYIKNLAVAKRTNASLPISGFGSVENPIQMMEAEHETAGEICAEIKKLSNNYTTPEDGCNTYRITMAELQEFEKDLHQHVHLENNILFPKAKSLELELKKAGW
ncbi:MAG: iron-sulfur cluster repair di-iron protein [Bacteroidia bacterium]